jgi:hypothetical protein
LAAVVAVDTELLADLAGPAAALVERMPAAVQQHNQAAVVADLVMLADSVR